MTNSDQNLDDAESERLALLSAAILVGVEDIDAGHHETVDDPDTWIQVIANAVTSPQFEHTPI